MTRRVLLCFVVLAIVAAGTALAGNTGKLAGEVKDAQTGEAVIGASVLIEGTTQGAATNLDGYYVILGLSPGKYTLSASAVGFNKKTVQNVSVSIDLTTTIDFQLTSTVVEVGEEITVTAERPLVQRDLTAKTAVVDNEQIAALPVTEVSQVLSLQAGFTGAGNLRGGRSGEVAYWIDGVPVTDAYNGTQIVEVNKNLVQELQLVSGAFNAEYGQAMSGIVNIATKEGGAKYTGGVSVYFGDWLPSDPEVPDVPGQPISSSQPGSRVFPGLEKVRPSAIRNFEANASGPVLGEDLTFFANGRYVYSDGWLQGFRRFNPQNIAGGFDSAGNYMLFLNPSGRGDSAMVSMNSSERWYAQGKLTWRATPTVKISGNYIFDRVKSRPYSAFRTEFRDYFYNPDGFGNDYNISNAFIFQLTHALSQNSFYTVGGSVFEKKYKYYLYDDWNDPRYVHPDVLQIRYNGWSFLTGGTDLRRTYRSTTTYLGKVDINSQLTSTHLLKGGVEFRKHRAFYEYYQMKAIDAQTSLDVTNPFITTAIPPTSSPNHDWYVHNPTELSGYIQDKMEFKDMIVNVGVRYDHFQPDGVVLNDDQNTYGLPYAPNYTVDDPDIYEPIKPYNKFFDYNLNGVKDPGELDKTVDDRRGYWYKKASAKWKISPRLGVSFPITARGIVHFSYGHFFQTPRFERLYENPEFKIGSGQTVVMGNADLEPEETINGEIGVQQQLTDDISIDVTAYLRDIRGLAGTEGEQVVVFGGSAQYYKYTNSDFGFVRGIVLTLNKRFSGGFTSTLDYTFQLAKGSASDPQDARNAKAGGAQPEIQLNPLNWDQRHTLNITLTYSASNWGLSTIAQYNSGQPYTPRRTTDITALMTNSQSKPPFLNLDIRAYYEFSISPFKLVAFGRVFNLLDIRNQTDVYLDTGQAGVTIDEANARSINPLTPVNSLSQWFRVPTQYSEPRRIEIGMNLEF